MSWRAIQDSVATSESLSALSDFAERLFWRLLAKSDPWGRLPGSPRKIKGLCVPLIARASETRIEKALEELASSGRILCYEVDGSAFIEIVDFDSNQPKDVLGRSGERYGSRIPDPPRGATPRNSAHHRATPAESESERKKESPLKGAKERKSDVELVYAHWRAVLGKSDPRYNRISPGRRQKITARLREFSAEDLCRAIDGVALDDWPDRSRYDDLTIIFRDTEHVDRFLGYADSPPAAKKGRGLTAAQILAMPIEVEH